ncbi:MAG: acyl-protein synthetase [Clostridiales bacterium]|nr:acyl-protein synthetase [Clostridiales bacterium]
MKAQKKLFFQKQVYDIPGTDGLFVEAARENVEWHYNNCLEYRKILNGQQFFPEMLTSLEGLCQLPPIPTLYLKQQRMLSIPEGRLRFKSTTTGTTGKPVEVGFDAGAMALGFSMLTKMLWRHGLLSPQPTNYLMLGYQPGRHNKMGAARTAKGASYLAPALHREYALVYTGSGYALNIEGIANALMRYSQASAPVRIIGFPAYFYFLLQKLEQDGARLKLPEKSLVFLGGGWKQFSAQKVEKEELYTLAAERLGLEEKQIKEFFGVVEHNVPYFSCENHHFHTPVFSRVIIRDIKTMEPLGYGEPGLLNLITPLLKSMPLVSIVTDDLAILREGQECGCGNPAPWFEILGRSGLPGIKTCAAGAWNILEGVRI